MNRATPTADLCAYAHERGLSLSGEGARKLRRRYGEEGARDRLADIAGLMEITDELASSGRCPARRMSQLAVTRRFDAAGGDYVAAAAAIVRDDVARRQRLFNRATRDLEQAYYARDAHARHAAVLADLDRGSLGVRAAGLLLAAADAGVTEPTARVRRQQLENAVSDEIDRLHPRRPDETPPGSDADRRERDDHRAREHIIAAQVAEHSEHRQRAVAKLLEPERDDRRPRRRDLALALNLLARSPDLQRAVEPILDGIKAQLRGTAPRGWVPDPDEYRARTHCAALTLVGAGDLREVVDLLGFGDLHAA